MQSTDPQIEAAARALYEAMDVAKPGWDQLGDVTKSVWRDRAIGKNTWPFKEAIATTPTMIAEQPKKLTLAERLALKGVK